MGADQGDGTSMIELSCPQKEARRIYGVAIFLLASLASAAEARVRSPVTPIEHVIVIIGENRTFDHLFATYAPPAGQSVWNLLSREIITADGKPGQKFDLARQFKGTLKAPSKFLLTPTSKTPYEFLPAPMTGEAPSATSDAKPPPFETLAAATAAEGTSLPAGDLPLLTRGATGEPKRAVDSRILNVDHLRSGPFPLTPGLSYDDYAASPTHRFYQMWQELDCNVDQATPENPSGCLADLFPWVEVSVGAGKNGETQPPGFNDKTTGEGGTAMGFYNVQTGDMPYFAELAREYAISDNYHQPVMGGTGANSIMLGAGDMYYFTDGHGGAGAPPSNNIENPDPQKGTDNWYTQDGYQGGSYSNCSDLNQPGVAAIVSYLASLPHKIKPNCDTGHFYLLNNYDPGYNGDGTLKTGSAFVIPPSPERTIADVMLKRGISWKYYGEGWNSFVANPNASIYCNICNPFLYETAIMTDPAARTAHLKDLADFYSDLAQGKLPAVSYVKPGEFLDGHPASSKFDLFEAFTKKIVDAVKSKAGVWAHTVIFITVDEGGGYYDSGYIEPLDFFGDGTRIPLIAVSPYSLGGRVVHDYADHASILKFIERNWRLPTITRRSRDNLPNPVASAGNPYVPKNSPAIDDLFSLFRFK